MPVNQPKPEIESIEDPLLQAYIRAWTRIQLEQDAIAADPAKWRRKARLNEVQKRIAGVLDEVDLLTNSWIKDAFPEIYAMGATAGATEVGAGQMVWTQIHQQAVQTLAQDLFNDLLSATKQVGDQTKKLVRDIAKDEVLQKAIEGKSAREAGKLLEKRLAESGIKGIKYANGAYHPLSEYAQMAVRTKTAVAYNLGSLNEQQAQGVKFWEVFDGPTCGWDGHNDTNQALGMIVTRDEALGHPISHPNCRRAFGARPDVTSKKQAGKTPGSVTKDQVAAQKEQDAERLAAQKARAASRARQKSKAQAKPQTPQAKPQTPAMARRQALLEQRDANLGNVDLSLPAPATDDMILKAFLADPYKDVPSVEQLITDGWPYNKAVAEHKRLKANAASKASKLRAKMKDAGDSLLEQDKADGQKFGNKAGDNKPNPKIVHSSTDHLQGLGYVGGGWELWDVIPQDTPNLIPVQNLKHEGTVIKNGIATRRDGIVYVMETPTSEAITSAMQAEFEGFIKTTQDALSDVPAHLKPVQKAMIWTRQNNPYDAHWAKTYNMPGFKSAATGGKGATTLWNTKPSGGTIRHEFGHNVDTFRAKPLNVGSTQVKWGQANSSDQSWSATHFQGAVETKTGSHPITPGTKGVTSYGAASMEEDYAESVRLYMKDAHDGVLAIDKKTGVELRFRDIYPLRARQLDEVWGVKTDSLPRTKWEIHATEKARADFSSNVDTWVDEFNQTSQDLGGATYKDATDFLLHATPGEMGDLADVASSMLAEQFGVVNEQRLGIELHAELTAKAKAAQAAKSATKPPVVGVGAQAVTIPPLVPSNLPSVAEMKKDLPANVKASIASKKSNTKKALLQSGHSEAEAITGANQVEAFEVERRWKALNAGTASQVKTQTVRGPAGRGELSPDFSEKERRDASAHLIKHGSGGGTTKNQLVTDISKRMNNEHDWDIFRRHFEDHGSDGIYVSIDTTPGSVGQKSVGATAKDGQWSSAKDAKAAQAAFANGGRLAKPGAQWTDADIEYFMSLDLKGVPVWDQAKKNYDAAFAKYGTLGPASTEQALSFSGKITKGSGEAIVDKNGKVVAWAKKGDTGKYGVSQTTIKVGENSSSAKFVIGMSPKATEADILAEVGHRVGITPGAVSGWEPKKLMTGYNGLGNGINTIQAATGTADVFGDVVKVAPAWVDDGLKIKPFAAYTAAEREKLIYYQVNARISQWASNSGDSQKWAVWMQMAVKEEFGTTGDPFIAWNPSRGGGTRESVTAAFDGNRDFYRTVARRMYENTQDKLEADGIEYLSLYRGMGFGNPPPTWAQYGESRVELQPINSWSSSKSIARSFANGAAGNGGGPHKVIIEARVPRERIISSAVTGFGCYGEYEFVVLDSEGISRVTRG